MFIELTDHLRCPADHPESFLVLIPDEMTGRCVRGGTLGCPVCRREYRIEEGVVVFGRAGGQVGRRAGASSEIARDQVTAAAVAAFLGLEGPGGYVALVGDAAWYAYELTGLLPGVHLAIVNPPFEATESPGLSTLRAEALPIKSGSMRGVVIGKDYAGDPAWVAAATASVLPGLRAVGEGAEPVLESLEILASAGGWWVGRRR